MRRSMLKLLLAALSAVSFDAAVLADVLYDQTNLIGLPSVASPSDFPFTATAAEALTVTLTDFHTPAAFTSLQVAVTLGESLVGMGTADAVSLSAAVKVPAASGNYVLRVIGTPDAKQGFGSFGVCVTRDSDPTPRACIAADSYSGNIQTPVPPNTSGTSTLSTSFLTTMAGNYTITLTDDAFPVALDVITTPFSALITPVVSCPTPNPPAPGTCVILAGTPTAVTIAAGISPQLLIVATAAATADPTVKAGLYGVHITDPSGASILARTIPVGALGSASFVAQDGAKPLTLTLSDLAYPAALTNVGIAVTSPGVAPIAKLTASGNIPNIAAPAGILEVWKFATASAQPGSYDFNLANAQQSLLSGTQIVNPGNTSASGSFAFVVNSLAANGKYQLVLNDFKFPGALQSSAATVAQNGTVLMQDSKGNFTASVAGPAVVLVTAQAPPPTATTPGTGIFSVTVQDTAATPKTLLYQTQGVGGLFDTQTVTSGTSGNYDLKLADLNFPANFANLAVLISQGNAIIGRIFGAGTVPNIPVTPGQYTLSFVANPSATANYGLYSVNVASSAPVITFSANVASVTAGQPVQLTWSTQNATSCAASGATGWSGNEPLTGTVGVAITATSTLTMTCTGPGGSTTSKPVMVTATQLPSSGKGGGGAVGFGLLISLAGVLALRRQAVRVIANR
jgi:plastocyanin